MRLRVDGVSLGAGRFRAGVIWMAASTGTLLLFYLAQYMFLTPADGPREWPGSIWCPLVTLLQSFWGPRCILPCPATHWRQVFIRGATRGLFVGVATFVGVVTVVVLVAICELAFGGFSLRLVEAVQIFEVVAIWSLIVLSPSLLGAVVAGTFDL